jgi:hypothetical protein
MGKGKGFILAAVMAALLVACAPLQQKTVVRTNWVASPNFDERRPNLVIIHHTSNHTLEQALHTLTSPERKVSSHYLIGRNGTIVQLVEENARAWHAGKSWWGGFTRTLPANICTSWITCGVARWIVNLMPSTSSVVPGRGISRACSPRRKPESVS